MARPPPTLTRPFSLATAVVVRRTSTKKALLQTVRPQQPQPSPPLMRKNVKNPNLAIHARNAARIMPPAQICRDTSRRIAALTLTTPRSATCAVRCTSPCPPCPCTSWRITWVISVKFAEKPSAGHGYCKATCDRIRATNLTVALIAENVLPTGPTFGLICKLIRLSRTSNASVATSLLRSSPTWTSTTSQLVLKTSPFLALILHLALPLLRSCPMDWPLREAPALLVWLRWIMLDLCFLSFLIIRNKPSWACELCNTTPKRPLKLYIAITIDRLVLQSKELRYIKGRAIAIFNFFVFLPSFFDLV